MNKGETLDAYHTRADVDKEITNQIIIGCSSQKHRRRVSRDRPTLTELLDAGRVPGKYIRKPKVEARYQPH
jgi:hypothetical protein